MRNPKFLAPLLLAACIGCGERTHEAEDAVPLDRIPGPALKAAQEELPGVKFESAWKEDGEDAYEIRGKTSTGKVRDVKVTAQGKLLEVD